MADRQDGFLTRQINAFRNRTTGTGTGCDGVNGNFEILPFRRMNCSQLETVYRSNKIIEKVVDILPEESGMIPGSVEDVNGEIDAEVLKQFDSKLASLEVTEAFIEADRWSRLYGDAFIILGINDGGSLDSPVNPETIRSVDWIRVRDRIELTPEFRNSSEFPEFYRYAPRILGRQLGDDTEPDELQAMVLIHHSRVLRFAGKRLPRASLFANGGYNDSTVQIILNDVLNYYQSIAGGNAMLMRSGIFVYKMFGLEDYAMTNNASALQNRFEFINSGISVFKSLFLDAKKGEDAQYVTQQFGGVDKVIQILQDHMIMVSGYPKSVIMGSSNSSAFSEGGESDRLTMANLVKRNQRFKWLPNMKLLLKYCAMAAESPVRGQDVELTVSFPTTLQLSPKEQAELEGFYATSDISRINSGVLTPQEVRESRYGSAEFGLIMTIDPDLNVDEMKAEKEEADRNFERERMQFQAESRQQNTPPRRDGVKEKPKLK